MYEFLFKLCILKCLNYAWIFIWTMYFKVLELCMKKKILTILRSEFILYVPCHVKNTFLTTLLEIIKVGLRYLRTSSIRLILNMCNKDIWVPSCQVKKNNNKKNEDQTDRKKIGDEILKKINFKNYLKWNIEQLKEWGPNLT